MNGDGKRQMVQRVWRSRDPGRPQFAIIKSRAGLSLHRYLLKLRIQRATELFLSDGGSIEEIAAQAGFPDPKYFAQHFYRVMGCSPFSFRGKLRGKMIIPASWRGIPLRWFLPFPGISAESWKRPDTPHSGQCPGWEGQSQQAGV